MNLYNMYMQDAVHNGLFITFNSFCFVLISYNMHKYAVHRLFITVSTLCFVLISYNMQTHDAIHHCLSPSVLSVLFWSRTTCTRMTTFITVNHLLYSVFHSELVQHADEQRYSSPSNKGFSKTWPASHTQPVNSCIQSSPWSYSNYRMWPTPVSKNFLHLNCTLSNVHWLKTACYLWKLFYNTNQQKQNTSVMFKFNYDRAQFLFCIMVC
jgi:hypothetical protein